MFLILSYYLFNVCISYANGTKKKNDQRNKTENDESKFFFLKCQFDIMERLYQISFFLPLYIGEILLSVCMPFSIPPCVISFTLQLR